MSQNRFQLRLFLEQVKYNSRSSDLIAEIKFVRIAYHDDFLYPRIQHHSLNQFQFEEMKNLPHKKVTAILIPGIQPIY